MTLQGGSTEKVDESHDTRLVGVESRSKSIMDLYPYSEFNKG